MALVTKQQMINALQDERPGFKEAYIGKALVATFNYQTEDEKSHNGTETNNNIGFSGSDARDGSITAKYFLKHRTLLPWMVENWMRDWRGAPRITKYARQLNMVAEMKAAKAKATSKPTPNFTHDQEPDMKHVFLGHTSDGHDVWYGIKFSEVIIRFGNEEPQYRAMDVNDARSVDSYQEAVELVNQYNRK